MSKVLSWTTKLTYLVIQIKYNGCVICFSWRLAAVFTKQTKVSVVYKYESPAASGPVFFWSRLFDGRSHPERSTGAESKHQTWLDAISNINWTWPKTIHLFVKCPINCLSAIPLYLFWLFIIFECVIMGLFRWCRTLLDGH